MSNLTTVLKEVYGYTRLTPGPVKLKNFHRIDVSKVISLMGLKKGVEVGVRGGHHSLVMCQEINDIDLTCVDIWEGGAAKWLEPARKKLALYEARFLHMPSMQAVHGFFEDKSLDFVYIDANHEFDYVMEDVIAWSRKVKIGGIISGHDYDRAHLKGVVPAVKLYTKMHKITEWYLTDQRRETSFFWQKEK